MMLRDVLEHDAGFGVLSNLAHKLFVEQQLWRTSAYCQQKLKKLLAAQPIPQV
jgi:hypothetical protein